MKGQCYFLRSHFTNAYERKSKSGQNDAQKFSNYSELSSSTGTLTAIIKKCVIMVTAMNCSSKDERTDLLDFKLPRMPVYLSDDSGGARIPVATRKLETKKRKRDAIFAMSESLNEVKNAFRSDRIAQDCQCKSMERTESLKQLTLLMETKRDFADDGGEKFEFVETELQKVKNLWHGLNKSYFEARFHSKLHLRSTVL